MTIKELKQELIKQGKDPNDFNIIINENGYSVTPKWFYEQKTIAKREDKPIIEDVNVAGETLAFTLMNSNSIAETLAFALLKITELEAEIAALKGE